MDPTTIKSMKLYLRVERIYDELRHAGIGEDDPLAVAELLPFDQYHYFGAQAVDEAMSTRLETVSSSTALRDLLPVFENDHVPLIVDAEQYHGLVTRIDFLNFLRRKMR